MRVLLGLTLLATVDAVFTPGTRTQLKTAIDSCITENSAGDCPNLGGGSYGPIGTWNTGSLSGWIGSLFKTKSSFNQDLNGWDVSSATETGSMFQSASAFNGDISAWDVSQVTNMYRMFYEASAFNRDITTWDTSKVTDMRGMFHKATVFNQDISGWDVSNVANMNGVFSFASGFNQDVSAWDVSSVGTPSGDMDYMFYQAYGGRVLCGQSWRSYTGSKNNFGATIASSTCSCPHNFCRNTTHNTGGSCNAGTCECPFPRSGDRCQNIVCPWGMQRVGDECEDCPVGQMSAYGSPCGTSCPSGTILQGTNVCMFKYTTKSDLKDRMQVCICGDTTPRCDSYYSNEWRTGVGDAEPGCGEDIQLYDVSALTDISSLFKMAGGFNQPLNGWDVSNVKYFSDMFDIYNVNSHFNQPLDQWDTSSAINMGLMFNRATQFNQNISSWDVSKVTNMRYMFTRSSFNQDLSAWDIGKVTNMYNTFQSAGFNQPLNWVLPPNCESMFSGSSAQGAGFGGADTSRVTNMKSMFSSAAVFNGDIGTWDVSNVETFEYTFRDAVLFNADISAWDVSSATNMYWMFWNAEVFNQDISSWDVRKVTNMAYMFAAADAFNQDISAWDVSAANPGSDMFHATNYDALVTAYRQATSDTCSTHGFERIESDSACEAAAVALGLSDTTVTSHSGPNGQTPTGCYFKGGELKRNNQYAYNNPQCSASVPCLCTEQVLGPNQLCGSSWVSSSSSDKPDNVPSVACDCPYNKCLNNTGNGVCNAGTCTCALPFEGYRCSEQCPDNKYNIAGGCDQCLPEHTKFKNQCRPDTQSVADFLDTVKSGKQGAERSKAVRAKFRPERDDTKTEAEMMVQLPVVKADLEPKMKELVEEMEATLGTVELEISIAAEVTSSSTDIADCHFDLSTQEPGKKTVLHAYGVDNYVFMCDSTSGTNTFVARAQEKTDGSEVSCWDAALSGGSGNWAAATTVAAGASHTCNGVPLLIGSLVPACGGGTGCCSDPECENGACTNNVCVCDEGFEGETCDQPTECKDITESVLYQKKGCCNC